MTSFTLLSRLPACEVEGARLPFSAQALLVTRPGVRKETSLHPANCTSSARKSAFSRRAAPWNCHCARRALGSEPNLHAACRGQAQWGERSHLILFTLAFRPLLIHSSPPGRNAGSPRELGKRGAEGGGREVTALSVLLGGEKLRPLEGGRERREERREKRGG